MKTEICRKCDKAIAIQERTMYGDETTYTTENAPSYCLKCLLKESNNGNNMECRYVRKCPINKH